MESEVILIPDMKTGKKGEKWRQRERERGVAAEAQHSESLSAAVDLDVIQQDSIGKINLD